MEQTDDKITYVTLTRDRRPSIQDLYVRGQPNSLNLIRLLLASSVIIFHSYSVQGIVWPSGGLGTLLGNFPVNGFFVLSGFLIHRSWVRKPVVYEFLLARVVRIYPAFWVCLLVTALFFAPLAALIQGQSFIGQVSTPESFSYIYKNATLAMFQWRIGDSPADIPYLTSWNASLWTLAWEFLCYLTILGMGLLGMVHRRWLLPSAFMLSVLLNVLTLLPSIDSEVLARSGRFSIFFLAGALVSQYSHRIRASWLLGFGATTLAVASSWIPLGWTIIQAPTAAIGLVVLGGLFRPAWAELKNDISYGVYIYAFPVQQLLAVLGFVHLEVWTFSLFALVLTIPFALASWRFVEKPALTLRKRLGYSVIFRGTALLPDAGASTRSDI